MSDLPLCKEPDQTTTCRFAARCHESRQRLQHYEGLRGMACWAYQRFSDTGALVAPQRQPGDEPKVVTS